MDRMDFPMLHLRGRAVNVLSLDLNVPASTWVGQQIQQSWPLPRPLCVSLLSHRRGIRWRISPRIHSISEENIASRWRSEKREWEEKERREKSERIEIVKLTIDVIPLLFFPVIIFSFFFFWNTIDRARNRKTMVNFLLEDDKAG